MPKELGGTGKGENPEQLFAMGYACQCSISYRFDWILTGSSVNDVGTACLLGAIQLAAGRMGKADNAKNAVVHTSVHIGEPKEGGGFGLAVDIKVENVDEDVLKAGHEACVLILSVFFFCWDIKVLRSLGLPL